MKNIVILLCCFFSVLAKAQSKKVHFIQHKNEPKVDVLIDSKLFTSFIYPDTLEKPVLCPIVAASNDTVTRGFPLAPREWERTDHPHHIGLWLNYESVNGLDFWNNSYNIPAAKKSQYGWIRNVQVKTVQEGKESGTLGYSANWENQARQVLLKETTSFVFSGAGHNRVIDRTTTLTAQKDTVFFKDIKDGFLAIRVAKELEMPSDKVEEFIDASGNRTKVAASGKGAAGSYLTSAGKKGDDAWGTRGNWCLLSAVKNGQPLSIAIVDHPRNPGYPAYWHARGYGLFAVNPLGQQVFSNGKEQMNLTLAPGQSVTFRYRVLITSGAQMTAAVLEQQAAAFAK